MLLYFYHNEDTKILTDSIILILNVVPVSISLKYRQNNNINFSEMSFIGEFSTENCYKQYKMGKDTLT
jgi:hypothetical protein